MEYRQFGQTDLQVSAMGFSCWEIGGTYGKIDEAQFQQAVQRAIEVRRRLHPGSIGRTRRIVSVVVVTWALVKIETPTLD